MRDRLKRALDLSKNVLDKAKRFWATASLYVIIFFENGSDAFRKIIKVAIVMNSRTH